MVLESLPIRHRDLRDHGPPGHLESGTQSVAGRCGFGKVPVGKQWAAEGVEGSSYGYGSTLRNERCEQLGNRVDPQPSVEIM